MRIAVVGAGPSGLYFAIRMAQFGGHELVVHEGGRAKTSRGVGYTISGAVVGALRQLDEGGADRFLTRRCVFIRPRSRFRAGGCLVTIDDLARLGCLRSDLLEYLRELAARYGVDVRYEAPVESHESCDADVVIAADGARSTLRGPRGGPFGAATTESRNRLFWGTSRHVPEGLSLDARRWEAGTILVNRYPVCSDRSAFVAELCPAEGAGEERLSEVQSEVTRDFGVDAVAVPWIPKSKTRVRRYSAGRVHVIGDAAFAPDYTLGIGLEFSFRSALGLALCLHEGRAEEYDEGMVQEVARIERDEVVRIRWYEGVHARLGGASIEGLVEELLATMTSRAAPTRGRPGRTS